MDHEQFATLSKKVDLLVKLTAAQVTKGVPFKEQVRLLSAVGLQPKDISDLTGKSGNHVSVTLYELKNSNKKVNKKDEPAAIE